MNFFTTTTVIFASALITINALAGDDADISTGKIIYTQCTGCHAPDYNRTGPEHCGLLGRSAGSVKGYDYTRAMSASGVTWTRETLDQFLQSPLTFIPGTSMGFAGIASAESRQQLIAYLSQLDDNNAICQ